MTADEIKDLAVRLIRDVWNGGNTDRAPEFFAGPLLEEALGLHDSLLTAFPDLRIDIDDIIAEDDKVVLRLTFRGTHDGPFRGIEPTGRKISFTAIRIYRAADGKFTESWANQDALGLLRQLKA